MTAVVVVVVVVSGTCVHIHDVVQVKCNLTELDQFVQCSLEKADFGDQSLHEKIRMSVSACVLKWS